MMPLPWLAGSPLAWRLDLQPHRSTSDSGVGSAKVGGRWNPVGYPVVYRSGDPATAILEVVVHTGFAALDTVPHVLMRARILEVADVHVVGPDDVPNAGWLRPGSPSRGQQALGRELLEQHLFVVIPTTVTGESWKGRELGIPVEDLHRRCAACREFEQVLDAQSCSPNARPSAEYARA